MSTLLLFLASAPAQATEIIVTHRAGRVGTYGGGGVFVAQGEADHWSGSSELQAPGETFCVGGEGFSVIGGQRRTGGEGAICGSEAGYASVWGGGVLGYDLPMSWLYGSLRSGFGMGWMGVEHDGWQHDGRADQVFVYARPTAALGVPLGFGAVEVAGYVMLPLPLYQEAVDAPTWGSPQVGTQLSLLFGDFSSRRR